MEWEKMVVEMVDIVKQAINEGLCEEEDVTHRDVFATMVDQVGYTFTYQYDGGFSKTNGFAFNNILRVSHNLQEIMLFQILLSLSVKLRKKQVYL